MSLERSTLLDPSPSDSLWQYDRRASRASHTSSSGRSTVNDGRYNDAFYTPNYRTSAEVRASTLLALSQQKRNDEQDYQNSKDSSTDPIMLPRKPKAETNLFPVDVDEEDTEDDNHSPFHLQEPNSSSEQSSFLAHVHTVSADEFSSKVSTDSGMRHSPPAENYSNQQKYSHWRLENQTQTWERDLLSTTSSDPHSNMISPYMAPMISVGNEDNENAQTSTDYYGHHSQINSSTIPRRKASKGIYQNNDEQFLTPISGLIQSRRSTNEDQAHLMDYNNNGKADFVVDAPLSVSSLSVSRTSLQSGNNAVAANNVSPSAAVTEIDQFSQQRANLPAVKDWSLSSDVAFPRSIPFPSSSSKASRGIMSDEGDKTENASDDMYRQNSPPHAPISPIQRASFALQKLNNFKTNVFGGSNQKSDTTNAMLKSKISAVRGQNEPMSSSALALTGLPEPSHYGIENNQPEVQQNENVTKSDYPPPSSRNWTNRESSRTSIGSQHSQSGSYRDVNKSLSSIKGRLRSISGNLRRRSLKLDNSEMSNGENNQIFSKADMTSIGQSRNASLPAEKTTKAEESSPLMHVMQPLLRQSSLTIASLATKKQMSPPSTNSHLTGSSDVQSEILRPEDAAMPFMASQRLLRPATSTGTPGDREGLENRVMASGWSFPVKQQEESGRVSRQSLNDGSTLALHNVRRKPVPGLNSETRPRTASSASALVETNTLDPNASTITVGKTPRLRNAISSTALNSQFSGTSNAKEHNATLPAILVPSNFVSQNRSTSANQLGPAYPRRRSSFNYQSITPSTGSTQKLGNDEPISPLTQTQSLSKIDAESMLNSRREAESSSVDTTTQPITPRRGSTSSHTKHVPLSTNGLNEANDRRKSSSAYSSNLGTPQQTKSGGGISVFPNSPRTSDAWQGYKQTNMSVESNFSHLVSNIRIRTSPEAHRPSVTSINTQNGTVSNENQFYQRPNSSQQQYRSSNSPANYTYETQLQTYLNEEDLQLIEETPNIIKNLDLTNIKHRLAVEFVNLGTKWSNSNRPLSIRSRRMSSETMREDAQSMYDGQSGFNNGEQMDSMNKFSTFAGTEKEQKKRREALESRERELIVEVLSKAEMAYAHIDIWTESRRGKWIVKCSAPDDSFPAESLPDISDPWMIPIDAKGIVRRKKLKSNIELSSTRTIMVCPDCSEAAQLNIAHNCKTCNGSERVEMVYTVQCIVRMAQFLPLKLPAALLLGTKQNHIKYIDAADPDHRTDILRDRALEGLQSSAARVIRVHNAQHGSRLLMGRVKINRIGLLSVSVRSNKNKTRRIFDIEDGPNGSIVEITQSSNSTNGRASVMSMGSNKIRTSSSRKSFNYDQDGDSIKSGKTSKSLFYSLTGGGNGGNGSHSLRKKKYGNSSSPNLTQTFHENPSSIPALPQNSNTFGHHHSRNLSDGQGNFYDHSESATDARLNTNSSMTRKRSLKSLFRQRA